MAYGMTIEKSQGQSLDKIGLCLSGNVFNHGQAYVAFSRVSGFADVQVFKDGVSQKGDTMCCENIVYEELLIETNANLVDEYEVINK